ncbi:MAG: 50S ribosomal protein L37ae [archaeon]
MATKKSMTSARFGVRYGTKVRKRIAEIEALQKKKHDCPVCHYSRVSRLSMGIWQCKHCNAKFAGGAWTPKTETVMPIAQAAKAERGFETDASEFEEPLKKRK